MSDRGVFERMAEHGHEQVVFCYDQETGMRAIIAIHSTALGPARGGTRYAHYEAEHEALDDALRLARGMAYKFAWTDMPRGGAKAVLLADPAGNGDGKQRQLRVYGRHVELLAGRFGTGPDYGTNETDMAEVASETGFVWGVSAARGGTGDSGPLTAQGVAAGLVAAIEHRFGSADLHGRSVAIQGLGSVGGELARVLVEAGSTVIGADPDAERAAALAGQLGIELVEPDDVYDQEVDVFSPNARGGTVNSETIPRLRATIVAGGANNQLGEDADGERLHARGILYAPDYVINSAGAYLIAGRGELGFSDEHLRESAAGLGASLHRIFARSAAEDRPCAEVADAIAEERIAAAARARALSTGPVHEPERPR
jgi:leucine dehydrogenase